ncbi:hypothetical protein Gogos_016615 [Gossypium gossypioides]|uniref:Uncharacterized protein n=1 Tax=Gossypium gossypioides TaxID=34282 RepID=A0A7J9B9X9_GOSGO|nr:hypothetical protein [Gossypium gossypioides]
MRRCRVMGGAATSAPPSVGSDSGSNMLWFYTDDAPGLKISPTVGAFIHVSTATITTHNRAHYFVSVLRPMALTFVVFGDDIHWASLDLFDVYLQSKRAFFILGLTPLTSLISASLRRGSLVGLAIPSTGIACNLIPARLMRAL